MIRIHQDDLSQSADGQSYGHLKVPHVTYMLGTPQIHFRLHKEYASRPQRALKGGRCAPLGTPKFTFGCIMSTSSFPFKVLNLRSESLDFAF